MSKQITALAASSALVGNELLEVSQLSLTVRIIATTLSAQASDNSYNDSANGFVTAGFAVGDRVNVSGFTGNAANNILVGAVTALTAGKMTIGGTDGDVIVDDAAGETVTISKWVSRRSTLDNAHGRVPFAAFAADISPAQITASQNDYNPANLSTAAVLRLSSDAAWNITGLAGGADGRLILLVNIGTFNITLKDEDAASTAANRFALVVDLALVPDGIAALLYDSTSSRWRLLGVDRFASAAEVQAGTMASKAIAPDQLVASAAPQTLTDGATINWDMALGYNAKVTLGGSRTMAAPTNPKVGLTYALEVIQDGTGNRLVTWNAAFDWGSAGTPTLSTAAAKRDLVFLYCYDQATPKFRATFNKDA